MIKQLLHSIRTLILILFIYVLEFIGVFWACICADHIFLTELVDNFWWVIGLYMSIKWVIAVVQSRLELKIGAK